MHIASKAASVVDFLFSRVAQSNVGAVAQIGIGANRLAVLGGISDVDLADALRDQFQLVENQSDSNRRRATRSRQMLDAVLSVPSRIDSGKKIVETLEKLVRLECEIYGITAASSEEKNSVTCADRHRSYESDAFADRYGPTRQQAQEAAAAR